jgi:hypothetical protein
VFAPGQFLLVKLGLKVGSGFQMFNLPENGRCTQEPEANATGVSAMKKKVLEPNSVLEGFIYMITYKRTYTFKTFCA